MAIFEVISTVTHKSLMNKSKWDLASWVMHLLQCRDEGEQARVRRVADLIEANNRYQQQARDARAELKRVQLEAVEFRPTHRHLPRGSHYQVIGTASLQCAEPVAEANILVVYRGRDGKLWARPHGEFHDGRFEEIVHG